MTLRECPEGSRAKIVALKGSGPIKRRLLEMGFVPGRILRVIRNAPLRDPMEVEVMGYHLAVRKDDAFHILVVLE